MGKWLQGMDDANDQARKALERDCPRLSLAEIKPEIGLHPSGHFPHNHMLSIPSEEYF